MDKIRIILEKYGDEIAKLSTGDSISVECPFCHDRLHISRSGYNGHLWIMCDNKCIFLIQ